MKARFAFLLEQLVKRCPKSGRIIGFRRDTRLSRVLFPVVAIFALGWLLARVIPSPRRAEYPCQKVAAGVVVGFLAYVAGLAIILLALRFIRRRLGAFAGAAFVAVVVAFGYYNYVLSQENYCR